jgi:hypothetical protein
MVSKIGIANLALQNIGANAITTLTESTVEAEQIDLRYESVRAATLEAHPWNFALKRVELSQDSNSPAFGYDNQFVLPSDFVRMVATEEQTDYVNWGSNFNGYLTVSNKSSFTKADNYKLEISTAGLKVLLSNDDAKKIIYVFDQQDTAKFSPMFVEMLSIGLSAAICYRLTNNASMAKSLQDQFEGMLLDTKNVDAKGGTYERVEQSTFIGVRN